MWKNWLLLVLGLFVIALPFLGLPSGARTFLFFLSGLGVIALSFLVAQPLCNHRPADGGASSADEKASEE